MRNTKYILFVKMEMCLTSEFVEFTCIDKGKMTKYRFGYGVNVVFTELENKLFEVQDFLVCSLCFCSARLILANLYYKSLVCVTRYTK